MPRDTCVICGNKTGGMWDLSDLHILSKDCWEWGIDENPYGEKIIEISVE
jgi:hypothetical protein